MLKQRSFVLNNNKENNSLITNMESEDIDCSEHDALYPYTKVLTQNNNLTNTQNSTKNSRGSFHLPPSTDVSVIQTEYSTSVLGAAGKNAINPTYGSNNYNSNLSNGSNGINISHTSSSSSSSSNVAQQLLNDVRALAAQNQRTELSLRDLQQKIQFQKGKRQTFILQNDNKENEELVLQQKSMKPTRIHSLSIQPTASEMASNKQGSMLLNQANDYHNYLLQYKPRLPGKQSTETIPPMPTRYYQYVRYSSQQVPTPNTNTSTTTIAAAPEPTDDVPAAEEIVDQTIASEEKAEPALNQQTTNTTTTQQNPKETLEGTGESISKHLARVLINDNYSQDILDHLCENEGKTVPKNCLLRHNIPSSLRAKMIDWMIEVMKSYRCTEETFFMGVRIMDLFLEKSKIVKEIGDLHLIGVACMFIAGKFEEIYAIRLQVMQERIAHKKFSMEQIKDMETEILYTLNFNLLGTSPYEIAMQTLTLAGYQETFSSQEFQYAHKICLYLTKMVLYDYEFNKTSPYSLLAASVIFIIFKIFQQINPPFTADHHIIHILTILKIDQKELVTCSTRILHLAKSFEDFFPDLTNLKKFNGFEMKQTYGTPSETSL